MDIVRSGEQQLLFDTAVKYLAEHYDFVRQQALLQRHMPFDRSQWRAFADLGWLALPLPQEHGGIGGGMADLGALMEAFGHGQVIEPYVSALVLAAGMVVEGGTDGQKAALLPAVADGSSILALAHIERGGHDRPSLVRTRATRSPSGWRIEGAKILVEGGHAADRLVVSARITGADEDPAGIGLFLVEADRAGVLRRDNGLLGGGVASDFDFQAIELPQDALLGQNEDAFPLLEEGIDRSILAEAWQIVGRAQALVDATIDYTRMRRQFGRSLSSNQALRHRVADMNVHLIEMRALTLAATLQMGGAATLRARVASAVKYKVANAGRLIAESAVQFHGGVGMTDDLPIGRHYRAILAFAIRHGSPDAHLRRYGALSFSDTCLGQGSAGEN